MHLSFFTPLPLSVGTQSLLFFGSDVGPLWSQSLKGSAVSIGCEIRKNFGRGDENTQWGPKWGHYSLGPFPL